MTEFDVVIRGGAVVDGTRMPRYRADIGVADGRVVQTASAIAGSCAKARRRTS